MSWEFIYPTLWKLTFSLVFQVKRNNDCKWKLSKRESLHPAPLCIEKKKKHKDTKALLEQPLWVGYNPRRQSEVSTFSPTNIEFKSCVLISRAGFVSIMRPLSFELIEQAIQLLLGCRYDAESFLPVEHSVVGEIEDDLAQAYAALGMACVFIFGSGEQFCLVWWLWLWPHLVGYLLVFQLKQLSLSFSFLHPKNVHPQLIAVLFWKQIFLSLQRTGKSQLPISRRASKWLRFAMGHPVLKWAMSSSNWPKSFSMGKSFFCFLALRQATYCSIFY